MSQRFADSSVVVAGFGAWHSHYPAARARLASVTALPAHAAVEAVSVLTRLPAPYRVAPRLAVEYLRRLDRPVLGLPDDRMLAVLTEFAEAGIRGGACYDGLIAATVRAHDGTVVTADRRAASTYLALGVPFELIT